MTHDKVTALSRERKVHDIKEKYTNRKMQARSPIILLGILKPVSHFRMDKRGGGNPAHRILSFNCQQCVAFYHDAHSLPFTNYGLKGFYQETMEKRTKYFPFYYGTRSETGGPSARTRPFSLA